MTGTFGLLDGAIGFSRNRRSTRVDKARTRSSRKTVCVEKGRTPENIRPFSRAQLVAVGDSERCGRVSATRRRDGGYKPQMQDSRKRDRRRNEKRNRQEVFNQIRASGVRQGSVRGTPDIDSGGSSPRDGREQEVGIPCQGCQGCLNFSRARTHMPACGRARSLTRHRNTPDTPDTLKVPSGIYKGVSGVPDLLIKARQGSVRGRGVVR